MADATDAPAGQPQGYKFEDAEHCCSHSYLLSAIRRELGNLNLPAEKKRIFDLGCGNGSVAAALAKEGYKVAGVDPSEEGIQRANERYPNLELRLGSAYDDLVTQFGRFPVVISLEVVEHVYFPKKYAQTLYDLVEPGGTAMVSTPYHGYLKNLALAATGKMDQHFTALWDHGHIKFWSINTLGELLRAQGFKEISFVRVGRIPALAKSMIAMAKK